MKVKELIRHLQDTDPDLEIFVSPLILLPRLPDVDNTDFEQAIERCVNPYQCYPVEEIALFTNCHGVNKGKKQLILGYEADRQTRTVTSDEVVH